MKVLIINSIKNELNSIYDYIELEGIQIKRKCDWYEHGENSTIFQKNLEKQQSVQNTIKKLIIDDTETDMCFGSCKTL